MVVQKGSHKTQQLLNTFHKVIDKYIINDIFVYVAY
jgi:hypothetical protein